MASEEERLAYVAAAAATEHRSTRHMPGQRLERLHLILHGDVEEQEEGQEEERRGQVRSRAGKPTCSRPERDDYEEVGVEEEEEEEEEDEEDHRDDDDEPQPPEQPQRRLREPQGLPTEAQLLFGNDDLVESGGALLLPGGGDGDEAVAAIVRQLRAKLDEKARKLGELRRLAPRLRVAGARGKKLR